MDRTTSTPRTPRCRRPCRAVLPIALALALTPGVALAAEAPLVPPVAGAAGPPVRAFEEPPGRFGPGHRGVDIAAPTGTPVHAAADGLVAFAGVVAGERFVTLRHAGTPALGTTYSFLSRVDVRPGDQVRAGDVIGATGAGHPGDGRPGLHFGVRRAGRYVDPAPLLLLAPSDVSDLVALGPLPDPGARAPGPAGAHPLAPPTPVARGGPPAGPSGRTGTRLGLPGRLPRVPSGLGTARRIAWGLGRGLVRQLRCGRAPHGPRPPGLPATDLDRSSRPAAPNGNLVIAVAGIGSSTWIGPDGSFGTDATMYRLDLRTLGYPAGRIFHFSYGGPTAASGADGPPPYRFHAPYGPEATFRPIEESAALLAALVSRVNAADPSRHIDIVAHSQGGVVAEYYLERLHDEASGPVIDHLVTIASPHRGADMAGLDARLRSSLGGRAALRGLDAVAQGVGAPPPSTAAARELAVGSPLLRDLERGWRNPTRTTTIAAALDVVVPPQRTYLPGGAHYTVDLPNGWSSVWAHEAVVGAERTKQIAYGALSDRPLPCTGLRDAIADHLSGPLIAGLENGLLDLLAGIAPAAG